MRPSAPPLFADQLVADPDQSVKNAAELLDRLLKDILTENGKFDVEKFMPLLSERIYVKNGLQPLRF